MEGEERKSSSLKTMFYLILLLIAVLAVLQLTGTVEVVGKTESEQLIQRPHDR